MSFLGYVYLPVRVYLGCDARNSVFRVSDKVRFKPTNNKGVNKTTQIHRLVCTFVVCKPPKTGFFALRPSSFKSSAHKKKNCLQLIF